MKGLCKNNKIDVVQARGVFKSATSVDVDGNVLEGKTVIIATGTSLEKPDIPGLDDTCAMTTDQILEMTEVPSSVLVDGSGAVEVEMAFIL